MNQRNHRILLAAIALFTLAASFWFSFGLFGNGYPFSEKMCGHLLFQLVVPPFILLAFQSRFGGSRWLHPVAAWLAGLGAMWLWHAPILCNAAVKNPALHWLQLISSLACGLVFWWPVFSPYHSQRLAPLWGMVYLFGACLGCTLLGILLTFAPAGLYLTNHLPGTLSAWSRTAPDDQRVGGLLMWVPGCLVYLTAIMSLLARWYAQSEEPTPSPNLLTPKIS